MQQLLDRIAEIYEISRADLIGRSRRRHVAEVRQFAAWVLRHAYPALSLEAIGEILGGYDHTTIIYSLHKVEERMLSDARLSAELRALIGQAPPVPPRRARQDPAMRWWATVGRADWTVSAA